MLYFIYALVDPRTDAIAYIGLTNNPNARFQAHMKHFKTNARKSAWIRQLQGEHLEPQMKILEVVYTREAAIEREKHWINHYVAQGASLVNIDHTFQGKTFSKPGIEPERTEKGLLEREAIQDAIRKNADSPWVSMRQAAKLFGTSANKISRLAERQKIKTRSHPFDERSRLVDLNELQALFANAPILVKNEEDESLSWYEFRLPTE